MEKISRKQAFALTSDAYRKTSSDEKYSAEEREDGLKSYLADLNKDYRNNKNEIFQIVEDSVNVILPKKVNDAVKVFAEYKNFANGETVRFKVKNGKIKAHAMAVGSVAHRSRVDNGFMYIKTGNVQTKIYEEYERFLNGAVDWTEMINMVAVAITDEILRMIYVSLTGIYSALPSANAHAGSTLDTAELDKIIAVVRTYGNPIIVGTTLAISQIPVTTSALATEQDKQDLRNKGFLGMYKGCPIVEIENSFEDESNAVKIFSDQYLFIIPAGQEKIVKVALEGGLVTRETQGADWSNTFEAYQKVGTSVMFVNHIGIYKNTSL